MSLPANLAVRMGVVLLVSVNCQSVLSFNLLYFFTFIVVLFYHSIIIDFLVLFYHSFSKIFFIFASKINQ